MSSLLSQSLPLSFQSNFNTASRHDVTSSCSSTGFATYQNDWQQCAMTSQRRAGHVTSEFLWLNEDFTNVRQTFSCEVNDTSPPYWSLTAQTSSSQETPVNFFDLTSLLPIQGDVYNVHETMTSTPKIANQNNQLDHHHVQQQQQHQQQHHQHHHQQQQQQQQQHHHVNDVIATELNDSVTTTVDSFASHTSSGSVLSGSGVDVTPSRGTTSRHERAKVTYPRNESYVCVMDWLSEACDVGGGATKRKRRVTRHQRQAANLRERRRMTSLNSAFDELRKQMPTFPHEKRLSRIQTLRLAASYISLMTEIVYGPSHAAAAAAKSPRAR